MSGGDNWIDTCKESVADCNANDVEKDKKNLEELIDAEWHHRYFQSNMYGMCVQEI